MSSVRLPALLAVVCCLSGCGSEYVPKSFPIRGQVTYKGKPVSQGDVLYMPVDPSQGRRAFGPIDKNGNFTLQTTSGITGVLPGKYQIAVLVFEPLPGSGKNEKGGTTKEEMVEVRPKSMIPERYTDVTRSGLTDEVGASHSGFIKLDLVD